MSEGSSGWRALQPAPAAVVVVAVVVVVGDSPQDFAVECSVSVRLSLAVDSGELELGPVVVGSRV